MRKILIGVLFAALAFGQEERRWSATTGDVAVVAAAYSATIQQPAVVSGGSQVLLDQIVLYCSVACSVTQSANGTAASATAGTITPILPTPLNTPIPLNFFTASNVGAGTAQGGILHIGAGGTAVLCLSTTCGNAAQVIIGPGLGTASNYSVTFASLTGTVNVTFYGRSR